MSYPERNNGFGLDYRSQNRSTPPKGPSHEATGSLIESHGGDLPELPHISWHAAVALITLGGITLGASAIKLISRIRGE